MSLYDVRRFETKTAALVAALDHARDALESLRTGARYAIERGDSSFLAAALDCSFDAILSIQRARNLHDGDERLRPSRVKLDKPAERGLSQALDIVENNPCEDDELCVGPHDSPRSGRIRCDRCTASFRINSVIRRAQAARKA